MPLIEFIAGFFLGLIADWYVKPHTFKLWGQIERKWRKSRRKCAPPPGNTIFLGNRDTGVCILAGDGYSSYKLVNLKFKLHRDDLNVSDFVKQKIDEIEKREDAKRALNQHDAWNGDMLHVKKVAESRDSKNETPILKLDLQLGKYYHFLATSGRLHELYGDGNTKPDYTEWREKLIGKNFNNWKESPPHCLIGLPANIHVFLEDNTMVFSRRSPNVAIAPNELAAAVNENVHPERDFCVQRDIVDIGTFLNRALLEELGWNDSLHKGDEKDPKSEIHPILFVADTKRVAYGLVCYAYLPITYDELIQGFNQSCKDRFESSNFIPFKLNRCNPLYELCRFVHENNLYNAVGVGAIYSYMMKCDSFNMESVHDIFIKLQK